MLPMQSTMSDFQLTIGSIFEHGVNVHAESEVLTWMGDRARRATFREVGNRVRRLACALQRLGIRPGDRVGTFCWNTPGAPGSLLCHLVDGRRGPHPQHSPLP